MVQVTNEERKPLTDEERLTTGGVAMVQAIIDEEVRSLVEEERLSRSRRE